MIPFVDQEEMEDSPDNSSRASHSLPIALHLNINSSDSSSVMKSSLFNYASPSSSIVYISPASFSPTCTQSSNTNVNNTFDNKSREEPLGEEQSVAYPLTLPSHPSILTTQPSASPSITGGTVNYPVNVSPKNNLPLSDSRKKLSKPLSIDIDTTYPNPNPNSSSLFTSSNAYTLHPSLSFQLSNDFDKSDYDSHDEEDDDNGSTSLNSQSPRSPLLKKTDGIIPYFCSTPSKLFFTLLFLLAGLTLLLFLYFSFHTQELTIWRNNFRSLCQQRLQAVSGQLNSSSTLLQSVHAYVTVSNSATHTSSANALKFTQFIMDQDGLNIFPIIMYAPVFTCDQASSLPVREWTGNDDKWHSKPSNCTDNRTHAPIEFSEPRLSELHNFDLLSYPPLTSYLNQAISEKVISISDPLPYYSFWPTTSHLQALTLPSIDNITIYHKSILLTTLVVGLLDSNVTMGRALTSPFLQSSSMMVNWYSGYSTNKPILLASSVHSNELMDNNEQIVLSFSFTDEQYSIVCIPTSSDVNSVYSYYPIVFSIALSILIFLASAHFLLSTYHSHWINSNLSKSRTEHAESEKMWLTAIKKTEEGGKKGQTDFLFHLAHSLKNPLHQIANLIDFLGENRKKSTAIQTSNINSNSNNSLNNLNGIGLTSAGSYAQVSSTLDNEGTSPVFGSNNPSRSSPLPDLELINSIKQQASIMSTIISDALDISRLEAGNCRLQYSPIHIQSLVSTVVLSLLSVADDRNIKVNHSVDADVPNKVWGDKTRVCQVLTHIIRNGIIHNKNGGEVTIRVKLLSKLEKSPRVVEEGNNSFSQSSLDNNHSADAVSLAFIVRDTGYGIDRATLPTLFEPFSQAKLEALRLPDGAGGLGLAIVQRVVTLMRGHIQVRSGREGSTFTIFVTFPLHPLTHAHTVHTIVPAPLPATVNLPNRPKYSRHATRPSSPAPSITITSPESNEDYVVEIRPSEGGVGCVCVDAKTSLKSIVSNPNTFNDNDLNHNNNNFIKTRTSDEFESERKSDIEGDPRSDELDSSDEGNHPQSSSSPSLHTNFSSFKQQTEISPDRLLRSRSLDKDIQTVIESTPSHDFMIEMMEPGGRCDEKEWRGSKYEEKEANSDYAVLGSDSFSTISSADQSIVVHQSSLQANGGNSSGLDSTPGRVYSLPIGQQPTSSSPTSTSSSTSNSPRTYAIHSNSSDLSLPGLYNQPHLPHYGRAKTDTTRYTGLPPPHPSYTNNSVRQPGMTSSPSFPMSSGIISINSNTNINNSSYPLSVYTGKHGTQYRLNEASPLNISSSPTPPIHQTDLSNFDRIHPTKSDYNSNHHSSSNSTPMSSRISTPLNSNGQGRRHSLPQISLFKTEEKESKEESLVYEIERTSREEKDTILSAAPTFESTAAIDDGADTSSKGKTGSDLLVDCISSSARFSLSDLHSGISPATSCHSDGSNILSDNVPGNDLIDKSILRATSAPFAGRPQKSCQFSQPTVLLPDPGDDNNRASSLLPKSQSALLSLSSNINQDITSRNHPSPVPEHSPESDSCPHLDTLGSSSVRIVSSPTPTNSLPLFSPSPSPSPSLMKDFGKVRRSKDSIVSLLQKWGPLRILIVDDSIINVKICLRMLNGFQCDTAENGLEAFEAVKKRMTRFNHNQNEISQLSDSVNGSKSTSNIASTNNSILSSPSALTPSMSQPTPSHFHFDNQSLSPYDVILMDQVMPVMSGQQATKLIRSLEASIQQQQQQQQQNDDSQLRSSITFPLYRALPIIAVTANASPSDRSACAEAGMNYFLAKPFTKEQLASVIDTAISKREKDETKVAPIGHNNANDRKRMSNSTNSLSTTSSPTLKALLATPTPAVSTATITVSSTSSTS